MTIHFEEPYQYSQSTMRLSTTRWTSNRPPSNTSTKPLTNQPCSAPTNLVITCNKPDINTPISVTYCKKPRIHSLSLAWPIHLCYSPSQTPPVQIVAFIFSLYSLSTSQFCHSNTNTFHLYFLFTHVTCNPMKNGFIGFNDFYIMLICC